MLPLEHSAILSTCKGSILQYFWPAVSDKSSFEGLPKTGFTLALHTKWCFLFYRLEHLYWFLSVLSAVRCYKSYQKLIPNGDRIPHPCGDRQIWGGVGHYRVGGGGARNQFGADFIANNLVRQISLHFVSIFVSSLFSNDRICEALAIIVCALKCVCTFRSLPLTVLRQLSFCQNLRAWHWLFVGWVPLLLLSG